MLPPPHAKYLVKRVSNGYTVYFVGTPCYGMHNPWWVPMTPADGEIEPITMLETDQWFLIDRITWD